MDARQSHSLAEKRVVVTRPRHQNRKLIQLLRAEGAEVIELPLIEIADPESWAEVDAAVDRSLAGDYDWIAFTSANGVARFLSRVADPDALQANIAAVAGATAEALVRRGLAIDLMPAEASAVSLAKALGAGPGTILLPRVEDAPGDMLDVLHAAGWEVDEIAVYRNVAISGESPAAEKARRGDFDIVTFASGSAARAFVGVIAPPSSLGLDARGDKSVVCIGPITARDARQLGFRVDAVAEDRSDRGLVDACRTVVSRSVRD